MCCAPHSRRHDAWEGGEDGPPPALPFRLALVGVRAYLGLADGAVECVVLLVIEQAEVQGAQGGCGQRGLRSGSGCVPQRCHPPFHG